MIQLGSVVELRSGGPRMTIIKYNSRNEAVCAWFLEATWYEHPFPESALKVIEVQP